jgi:hypothetical protein
MSRPRTRAHREPKQPEVQPAVAEHDRRPWEIAIEYTKEGDSQIDDGVGFGMNVPEKPPPTETRIDSDSFCPFLGLDGQPALCDSDRARFVLEGTDRDQFLLCTEDGRWVLFSAESFWSFEGDERPGIEINGDDASWWCQSGPYRTHNITAKDEVDGHGRPAGSNGSLPVGLLPVVAGTGRIEAWARGEPLPPTGQPRETMAATPNPDVPCWNLATRRLTYQGVCCAEIRRYAPRRFQLLDEFEAKGWPQSIESPFRGNDHLARQTVGDLNRNLTDGATIRFHFDNARPAWKPVPRS